MYIEFSCPNCESDIEVSYQLFGEKVICPNCTRECIAPLPGLKRDLEFDNFILEKRLGQGGMGEVWLATQYPMERPVAIKILSPRYSTNDEFIDLFLREVRLTGKMEHPNIVTAFTAGLVGDFYYLAMTYIDGHELDEMLDIEGAMEEREALKIVRAVAEALKYAWNTYKLLHCDIKPSNIMLDINGIPKLMDLGISKTLSEETNEIESVTGTPYYMSPEQARKDKEIDFRADLYSLGATLYHMVTGTVPFEAPSSREVLIKHIDEPLTQARERNPRVSKNCSDLIDIMMTKSPWLRHSSWEYLISDIDMVLSGKHPAGIDIVHKKHDDIEGEDTEDKVERILSESTEINLTDKMLDEINKPVKGKSSSTTANNPGNRTLKTLPPKTIVEKPKWRNWLFIAIAMLILALLVGAVWITAIKVNSLMSPVPDSGTEETTEN